MNYKNYDINAPEFDSKIKYYLQDMVFGSISRKMSGYAYRFEKSELITHYLITLNLDFETSSLLSVRGALTQKR